MLPVSTNDARIIITKPDFDERLQQGYRPYAWVRGAISNDNPKTSCAVLVKGPDYKLMCQIMEQAVSVSIRGIPDPVLNDLEKGKTARMYRLTRIVKAFDAVGRDISGTDRLQIH